MLLIYKSVLQHLKIYSVSKNDTSIPYIKNRLFRLFSKSTSKLYPQIISLVFCNTYFHAVHYISNNHLTSQATELIKIAI